LFDCVSIVGVAEREVCDDVLSSTLGTEGWLAAVLLLLELLFVVLLLVLVEDITVLIY
jgi:hypothetical protein